MLKRGAHSDAEQASAKSKARLKDLDEEYSMFRPPVASVPAPNMYRSLDPGLNLAADYYDSFSEGYGNLHDARKVGAATVLPSCLGLVQWEASLIEALQTELL